MTHEEFAQRIVDMQQMLYRVSSSLLPQLCDREDAVQSCIEKAWHRQDALRDEAHMQAWVVRILINECYAILRHRKREVPLETLPEAPAPPGADLRLHSFFADLPEKLRLPMVLHYLEGYDICEIAKILRVPAGTVKSRLSRGRQEMRRSKAFEEVQDL